MPEDDCRELRQEEKAKAHEGCDAATQAGDTQALGFRRQTVIGRLAVGIERGARLAVLRLSAIRLLAILRRRTVGRLGRRTVGGWLAWAYGCWAYGDGVLYGSVGWL